MFFNKFQKSKDKISPWPLCLGGKHERHPRIFLPLAMLSPHPQPYSVTGGLLLCQHYLWERGTEPAYKGTAVKFSDYSLFL